MEEHDGERKEVKYMSSERGRKVLNRRGGSTKEVKRKNHEA